MAVQMDDFRSIAERVVENVERVIVGKHYEGAALALIALICRGHLLIEGRAGRGEDDAGEVVGALAGLHVQADAVHAGPATERRDRRLDLQPEERGVRVSTRPRSWRRSCSPMK